MSYTTKLSKYRASHSWSTQFGLYKYRGTQLVEDSDFDEENNCKKNLRYILVTIMALIILTVVCLMVFDFSAAVDQTITDNLNKDSLAAAKMRLELKKDSFPTQTISILAQQHPVNIEKRIEIDVDDSANNETFIDSSVFDNNTEIFFSEAPLLDLDATASDSKASVKGVVRSSLRLFPRHPPDFRHQTNEPTPFYKTSYNLNYPQLSNFRNRQKSKNLEELLRYMNDQLNKDVNKKNSPARRIKFSGIYLQPRPIGVNSYTIKRNDSNEYENNKNRKNLKKEILSASPTEFTRSVNSNKTDPFIKFKPNQPGDINLLAENMFRFAPSLVQTRLKNHINNKTPNLIPISSDFNRCNGYNCNNDKPKINYFTNIGDTEVDDAKDYYFNDPDDLNTKEKSSRVKGHSKKRPLSVMLDIYPMENQDEETMAFPEHLNEPISTSTTRRPKSLRPYPNYNTGYHYVGPPPPPNYKTYPNYIPPYPGFFYPGNYHTRPFKQQKIHTDHKAAVNIPQKPLKNDPFDRVTKQKSNTTTTSRNKPTQMVVQLNLYPRKKIVKNVKYGDDTYDIIDRTSHAEDDEYVDSESTSNNLYTHKNKTSIHTSLRNVNISSYENNNHNNLTIDDIRNGYGFQLPGPEIEDFSLPDEISNPAIQLSSLSRRVNEGLASKTHESVDDLLISHDLTEDSVAQEDRSPFFEVSNENYNKDSTPSSYIDGKDFSKSENFSTSLDEFIAVPLLD